MVPFLMPWRWGAALLLLALVGAPLLWPIGEFVYLGFDGWSGAETWRVAQLLKNTLLLIAGTLALALPVGVGLALVLFRTEFPGRRVLRACVFALLFVPLPMIASAWQALAGSDGWLPWMWWGPNAQRRWTSGLGPAIWVHFVAGLPWVIFFVGMGLTWVERELEEEGLLLGSPWWVIRRITLPRCRGAIVFAAVWLALQVGGEITVVYMMEVATFAEDVHVQYSQGPGAAARSVTSAAPLVLAAWGLLAWYLPRLEKSPPLQLRQGDGRRFDLGPWRWAAAGLCGAAVLAMVAIPVASLLWKVGQMGHPAHWDAANAWNHLTSALRNHGLQVAENLLTVVLTGAIVSFLALLLCWLSDESRLLRWLLVGVLALAWSLPGPIVGIGLKETINWLPDGVLADLFFFGATPLPLVWAYLVRFLPFAVAVLWPIIRLVPREPREAARLEGQGPWREFWTITWPLTRRGVLLCGILVSALCLGEVAASTRVETPGWESYAKLLFDRMHYGVTNDVAAMSLLLLGAVLSMALASWLFAKLTRIV